ncbi:MAG: argininosuccinate lyase [Sedimentisphaerales bacterium]|jgi:argininosuccinate lyase|nr:argininosuccinate lyase [Sedimentisphaerales bacterium]
MPKGNQRSWEKRLQKGPDRNMLDFVQSLDIDWQLYPYDITGSIAHARMLANKGLIPKAAFNAIRKGLLQIERQIRSGRFTFDKTLEDIHMAIEAALVRRIGRAGLMLHTARSRNDQVATDIRLWMKDRIHQVQQQIVNLQKGLVKLASGYIDQVMPAYTHLQRAQPVSIAAYILSHVEPLERDHIRMGNCMAMVDCSPLGCGAVAGSTLPIDCQMTAKELGFAHLCRNSIDAVADRDFAAEFIFDCAMIGLHLSRLATDWIIFSSTEFGFIRIDDAFCTSSSMMPQKRNPDALELVRAKAASLYGALVAILSVLRSLPSGYNRDLQEDKVHIFSAAQTTEACLDMTAQVVAATRFQPDRIAAGLDDGFLDATALAEYLVGKGIPFRRAHGIVGSLVADCDRQRLRLRDLPLGRLRRYCRKIDKDVYKVLGAANVARSYRSFGAAGTKQAAQMVAYWTKVLQAR